MVRGSVAFARVRGVAPARGGAGVAAALVALAGLAGCRFDDTGSSCLDWPPPPLGGISVAPPIGPAGSGFTFEFDPAARADAYEACTAEAPYADWSCTNVAGPPVTFALPYPGRYEFRVRPVLGGCGDADWATSVPVTAQMIWNESPAGLHWSPRVNHESAVFNGGLWVLGGFTDTGISDEIWSSSDGTTWAWVAAGPHWSGRGASEALVYDDRLWILGGLTWNGEDDDVWSSPDGVSWTNEGAAGHWSPRSGHAAAVLDGKMWVTGGSYSATGNYLDSVYYADVWSSVDGQGWVEVNAAPPWPARTQHTLTAFEGQLWLLGGRRFDTDTFFDDAWVSADGAAWTEATVPDRFPARSGHSAVVWDGRLWVMAGAITPSVEYDDLWYTLDGSEWLPVDAAGLHWSGRKFHTSAVFDDRLWLMGGWNQFTGRNDDVWSGP
ncbi:MAG TPA: hypothetical protein VG389_12690 [Myxococcota bacterium]|nr:hypothetical protein [Myxococcota bacterium]